MLMILLAEWQNVADVHIHSIAHYNKPTRLIRQSLLHAPRIPFFFQEEPFIQQWTDRMRTTVRFVQQLKIISVLLQTQWTTMLRKSPSLQSIETSRYGVSGQGRNKVELVYEFVPNITPCDFRTISQQQACRWARQHPQLSQLTERLIPRRWSETPPQGPSQSQPSTDIG